MELVGRPDELSKEGFSTERFIDPILTAERLAQAAACIRELVDTVAMLSDELEVANLYSAPGAEA